MIRFLYRTYLTFFQNKANLVSTCDDYKHVWSRLDAVNILLRISKLKESTRFNVHYILAYLLDDQQIENIVEIKSIVETILVYMLKAKHDFDNENLMMLAIQTELKGKTLECLIHHVDRGDGIAINIKELLECLYKLSVSEKIKTDVYSNATAKVCFKTYLEKSVILRIEIGKTQD